MSVVIETTKGIFTVDLFIDERPKGKNMEILRYLNEKPKERDLPHNI